MQEHTPGPWRVLPDVDWPKDDLAIVDATGDRQIATVAGNDELARINAVLLSVAPEMLGLLVTARQYIADLLEDHEQSSSLLDEDLKPRHEFLRDEDAETSQTIRADLVAIDAILGKVRGIE